MSNLSIQYLTIVMSPLMICHY